MATTRRTEGHCIVCKGKIVEVVTSEFDPMTGPPVVGPGSRRQFKEASKGYYCEDCGLKYQFIPQKPS